VTLDAGSEKKINYAVTYNWDDSEPLINATEATQSGIAIPTYNQPEISSAASSSSKFNVFNSKKH